MGDAMEEGTILKWLKREGEQIQEGETVAEIQTEKATIEIPATVSGPLTQILVKEGETVPVGTPIAIVGEPTRRAPEEGVARPAAAPTPPEQAVRGREEARGPVPAAGPAPLEALEDRELTPGAQPPAPPTPYAGLGRREPAPAEAERVKASPLARKIAAERGIDLRAVRGTGPGGRIIEADVEEALRTYPPRPAAPAAPAPAARPGAVAERPMSPMRRVIARRLSESKQTIPHFYLTVDVDMRAAWRLRQEYNAGVEEERRISINDMVVRAAALALEKHPALNSRLEGDVIRTPAGIHIGVAVSLEEGLIVPVVRDANLKSISVIGREVRALADRARRGQLAPEEYSGGTFTISNLGMYDVTHFQAIINPPEAAILAVGTVRETPIVENGQIVPGRQMYLTISADHRIVDGSVAAEFMRDVKRLLQSPLSLLG